MDASQNISDTCIGADYIINVTDPNLAMEKLFSNTAAIIYIAVIPIVCIVGIVGNGIFCVSVFMIPSMQNSLTAFMINLAFADIATLAMICFWADLDYLTTDVVYDYPVYTDLACYAYKMSVNGPYTIAVGFITLISVERYLAICVPMKHLIMKGTKHTLKMIIAVYIIMLTLCVVFVSGYELHSICYLWPSDEAFSHLPAVVPVCASNIFSPLFSITMFFITLLINCSLSFKIISALMNRELKRSNSEHLKSVHRQVTRTLIINNVVFFLCQLPLRISFLNNTLYRLSLSTIFNAKQSQTVYGIGNVFVLINSCINPILYVTCCRMYRHAMRDSLKKLVCSSNPRQRDSPSVHCIDAYNRHGIQNDGIQTGV